MMPPVCHCVDDDRQILLCRDFEKPQDLAHTRLPVPVNDRKFWDFLGINTEIIFPPG